MNENKMNEEKWLVSVWDSERYRIPIGEVVDIGDNGQAKSVKIDGMKKGLYIVESLVRAFANEENARGVPLAFYIFQDHPGLDYMCPTVVIPYDLTYDERESSDLFIKAALAAMTTVSSPPAFFIFQTEATYASIKGNIPSANEIEDILNIEGRDCIFLTAYSIDKQASSVIIDVAYDDNGNLKLIDESIESKYARVVSGFDGNFVKNGKDFYRIVSELSRR